MATQEEIKAQMRDTQTKLEGATAQQTTLEGAGYGQPGYTDVKPQYESSGEIIRAENIQPIDETPFVSADKTSITAPPVVPKPTYEATPKETEISTMIQDLMGTSGLAGEKEAYRVEQEKMAGLEAMRTSEADYTAQLTQLEAEWKNIENKMQLQAEGRGITAGGLAPLTMAEQRKISIQANTVGALLAATQGKITFAQSQVDRAVNAKYAQREADRKAKLENLQLLSQDPTLTVEQQQRANAQIDYQNQAAEADAQKKTDTKTIMNWAVELANNPLIAQQLMKLAQEETPNLQTAFALYSQNLPKEAVEVSSVTDKLLSPTEAKTLGVPYGTTQSQAAQMGITPSATTTPNLITMKEAQDFGLPLTLAGQSEEQIMTDLRGSTTPQWFWDYINAILATDKSRKGQTISPQEAESRWNEFRSKVMGTVTTSSGRTI